MNAAVGQRCLHGSLLAELSWDTETFGFRVGKLTVSEYDAPSIAQALQHAREQEFRLLYWATATRLPAEVNLVLRDLGGTLVDRKVTYEADLLAEPSPDARLLVDKVEVVEHVRGLPSPQLVALAITAGRWSRFQIDAQFPRDRFVALYETWIRRSTLHELADVVLVAATPSDPCIGMATISLSGKVAHIGLIAVDDRYQGKGVGSLLLRTARRWMLNSGATLGRVVTQLDNTSACKLYERHGFALVQVAYYYHFWIEPLAERHIQDGDEADHVA